VLFLFLALFLFCMSLSCLILKKNYVSIFLNLSIMLSSSILIFYIFLKKSQIIISDYNFIFFTTISFSQFVIGLVLINKYSEYKKTINIKE
jgi:NADH:ubiquinone oxidoreductase subunit K